MPDQEEEKEQYPSTREAMNGILPTFVASFLYELQEGQDEELILPWNFTEKVCSLKDVDHWIGGRDELIYILPTGSPTWISGDTHALSHSLVCEYPDPDWHPEYNWLTSHFIEIWVIDTDSEYGAFHVTRYLAQKGENQNI